RDGRFPGLARARARARPGPQGAPMNALVQAIAGLGAWVRGGIEALGFLARFVALVLARSGIALRRPRLVVQQLHFLGNHSLLIIIVSGVFVGFVLGLQGYYTLSRYGSEEALGVLVAL